jgi:regulator of RNase E activity RraA
VSVLVNPRDPAPLPEELLARWRRVPVSVAVDLAPADRQIDPAIRPILPPGRQPALFGRAVTAICAPPDFGAVLMALQKVGPGEVLLIDAGGHAGHAMIGDVLGGDLARRGGAGVVCDGAVRDVGELGRMPDFPVYSRFVTPRGPTGAAKGVVDGPATIGGCRVLPGDLILGDEDGLVALTPELLVSLIEPCEAKLAKEDVWRARLAAGDSVEAIFGL